MKHQRDAFITELFDRAKGNKDIFLLSADFGAPALDQFREQLPEQFIHCGISEQNMVDLAAGLALDGRQVFCYAMAPFVSLRCLEQHKCATGIMNLPVCTLVAGVGLGYADAGPTHYATEDLACLRAIINSHVLTASDAEVARLLAIDAIERPRFSFVRLDRQPSADLLPVAKIDDVRRGLRIMREGKRLAVVTHGFMLGRTLEAIGQDLFDGVAVIDLVQVKPIPSELLDHISRCDAILTIEEQTPSGGLGAAVLEAMVDGAVVKPFYRLTLPEQYFFDNGGRAKLLELAHLSPQHIAEKINAILAAAPA
ncbi:MAG: transketolase family protein [Alphaproteobacteria bacterium]